MFLIIFVIGFIGYPLIIDEIETISKIDYKGFQKYMDDSISDFNSFLKNFNINGNIKSEEIFLSSISPHLQVYLQKLLAC